MEKVFLSMLMEEGILESGGMMIENLIYWTGVATLLSAGLLVTLFSLYLITYALLQALDVFAALSQPERIELVQPSDVLRVARFGNQTPR